MSTSAQTAAAPRGRGRRPGFGGWRPLIYQLTSYSLVAAANALLSLALINGVVFYGGIEGGWPLLAAAAVTALTALAGAYILSSAWIFRSSALFRGQLFTRFLLVGAAGAAVHLAAFAAVAYPLLASEAHPNRAATAAELAALAAAFLATFLGLRLWAYRRGAAAAGTPPPLATAGWTPSAELDPELASIAAGERQLRALWRGRYLVAGYGGALGLLLAYGWYSTSHLGMNNGDGTARVTQAFAAVFSRDPHLGTLSLIWPPVPALVDLPLVVLLQPFGQAALAAPIMGALFMAGAAVVLFLVLREVGAGRALATALTVAFLTHQHVYHSAAAGLSRGAVRDVPARLDARLRALAEERIDRHAGGRRPDGGRSHDVAIRGHVLGRGDGRGRRHHAAPGAFPCCRTSARPRGARERRGRRSRRRCLRSWPRSPS